MKEINNERAIKLNWLAITKKYWKEQVIFGILTTLSAVVNYVMDSNLAKVIENLVKGKLDQGLTLDFWNKKLHIFQNKTSFFWFWAIYIIFYCVIVVAHVYYAFYLANKISRFLKEKISAKLFRLKYYSKEKILTNLDSDEKTFTHKVVHYPNQVYYVLLTAFLIFAGLWIKLKNEEISSKILIYGLFGFVLVAIVCLVLNYFVYRWDLSLQRKNEQLKKNEGDLVNHRDLIIKKSLDTAYRKNYQRTVNKVYSVADKRDWKFTLAMVVPSFSLIPSLEFIFIPLACLISGKYDFASWHMLSKLYGHEKKIIDRLKDYPYYFSAQKRLNWLLNQPERDEVQRNILIAEPIETITLKKVSFSYRENKPVLKNLDWQFQRGKVNHLVGKNGFGKSTIISLIMGLHQPNRGQILVNDKYELDELNLIRWREKIAYAEHENLVENGLSTGQKQLADLKKIFANSENKEIFIFDEADNALDEENKKEFREKIEKVSKKKLVILISH